MIKVIVTGATGMVGKGVLLECLDHPEISEVLSVGRRSLEMNHPKLKELIHNDFSEFNTVAEKLRGYDACYHSMGVTSMGKGEAEFTLFTYNYTLALAKTLVQQNPEMTLIYVSGKGTDSTEKGKTMWARVKGKTENALLNMGFKQAFMFRPGAIVPKRGVRPSSKIYAALFDALAWSLPLFKKLAPNSIVDTAQIGQAMISATLNSYNKSIIDPIDILILAKKTT